MSNIIVREEQLSFDRICPHCGKAITAIDRFMRYVSPEPNTGCWLWVGHTAGAGKRYGAFWMGGINKTVKAHRASYAFFVREVPDGLVIDHLCRNTFCVNPQHLEAVTHRENTIRGLGPALAGARSKAKTHCPQGHPYDDKNTRLSADGRRYCRQCSGVAARKCNTKRRIRRDHHVD